MVFSRFTSLCSLLLLLVACHPSEKPILKNPYLPYNPAQPPTAQVTNKSHFIPQAGKTLLIIGQDLTNFNSYCLSLGKKPGGFSLYTSVEEAKGLSTVADYGAGINLGSSLLSSHSNMAVNLGVWVGPSTLPKVVQGLYDSNIDSIALWVRDSHRPVYLRFGYEFDGAHNAYPPSDFKAAWIHFVSRFRALSVTNVDFVWHSVAAGTYLSFPFTDWYPGDGYVDWVAVSIFDQILGGTTTIDDRRLFAQSHGKPFMIAEATPRGSDTATGGTGLWNGWYQTVLNYITTHDVKIFAYINADWDMQSMWSGQGWGNSRVQDSPTIRTLWTNEMNKSRWLQSTTTLYQDLGFE